MTDRTSDLKPCPFCGHTPQDWRDFLHPTGGGWRDDAGQRHYIRRDDPRGTHGEVWELGCLEHEGGCGATMYGDSRAEVLAKWNARATPSSPPEPTAEHWRMAIEEWEGRMLPSPRKLQQICDLIEQRARELAQEGK